MVPSIFGKSARRRLAVAVMVAYGAPPALALATEAVHAMEHAVQLLAFERDRLAAVGLLHGFSEEGLQTATRQAPLDLSDPAHAGYVHEHDGTRHAHGSILGGALEAEWTDRADPGEGNIGVVFALHLPAGPGTWFGLTPPPIRGPTVDMRPSVLSSPTPPLPPPRV